MPRPPRMVTTCAVLLEVMDALSSPPGRTQAVQFWRQAEADPALVILPLDDDLLARSLGFFEQHRDKAWSLTDCISFVVMRDRGIVEALTGDRHFEQAGFRIAFP